MKKFCVTISRVGCLFVMAENESDAMYIANRQHSDTVKWFDNWEATDNKNKPKGVKDKSGSRMVI